MRVGLDISSAVDPRPTGVAAYIRRLVGALGELDDPLELRLLCRLSRRRRGAPGLLFPGHPIDRLGGILPPRGIDLLHAADIRIPRGVRVPVVATIHDLTALKRIDHASRSFLDKKRRAYRRAARRAKLLITQTESVRDEIVEVLEVEPARVAGSPRAAARPAAAAARPPGDPLGIRARVATRAGLGVAVEPVKAALPGAGATGRDGIPIERGERLLIVGGPSRRKGRERLLPLLELWEERLRWRPEIVWAGSATEAEAGAFLDTLPAHLRDRITFRGHVPDAELDRLYRESMGLLVISDSEGFGIPLLEAAARDCPVLALESPPLREVLEDTAFWFHWPPEASLASFQAFLDNRARARLATAARERAGLYS
ncbi:MAG: glycosyltransferase, partial [Planctomycetota bacterium]